MLEDLSVTKMGLIECVRGIARLLPRPSLIPGTMGIPSLVKVFGKGIGKWRMIIFGRHVVHVI